MDIHTLNVIEFAKRGNFFFVINFTDGIIHCVYTLITVPLCTALGNY